MPKKSKKSKKTRKIYKRKRKNRSLKGGIFGFGKKKKGAVGINIRAKEVAGKIPLVCDICKSKKFIVKQAMIRGGRAASFFDLEWAFDKYSRILICNKCTKIHWFRSKDVIEEVEVVEKVEQNE